MRRQLTVSLILIAVLLSCGVGIAHWLIRTRAAPESRAVETPGLLVHAVRLDPCTVVEPIVGFGTARADRMAWVSPQVAGEVVALHPELRVGSCVGGGEVLFRIDERDYVEQRERARSLLAAEEAVRARLVVEEQNLARLIEIAASELDIARREYDRVLGLFEQNSANRRELDQARMAHEKSRRELAALENQQGLLPHTQAQQAATCELRRWELATAERNVQRCAVTAPFDGRLEQVDVELGERVAPGDRLIALLDPDHVEVPIELPVSIRPRVSGGAACRLTIESDQTVVWTGQVTRIAPSADPATRTFAMFVEVDNTRQSQPLMPGLFLRAQIDGPTLENVLVVPRGSVQQNHVFLYRDGRAVRQSVQVECHLLNRSVVSGLAPGVWLITSNLDLLTDGTPVRLESESAASPVEVEAAQTTVAGDQADAGVQRAAASTGSP